MIALGLGIFGVSIIRESYFMEGISMEWRISAGVAALSFLLLTLLGSFHYPSGLAGMVRRWGVAALISLAGGVCLALLPRRDSDWADATLLAAGVDLIHVARAALSSVSI